MNILDKQRRIKQLVSKSKTEEAITEALKLWAIDDHEDILNSISASFHNLKKEKLLGNLSPIEITQATNLINSRLLETINLLGIKDAKSTEINAIKQVNLTNDQFLNFIEFYTKNVRTQILFEIAMEIIKRNDNNEKFEGDIIIEFLKYKNPFHILTNTRYEVEKIGISYNGKSVAEMFDEIFGEHDYEVMSKVFQEFIKNHDKNLTEKLTMTNNFIKNKQEEIKSLIRKNFINPK